MNVYLFSNLENAPVIGEGIVLYIPAEEKMNDDYSNKIKQFQQMGFSETIVYPIGYFYNPLVNIEKLFQKATAICLGGGNTILYNFLLKKRNLYPLLYKANQQNKTLIGISAGGIVLSPTTELSVDADGNILNTNDFSALNLIPFVPKPHYNNCIEYEHRYRWFEKYSGLKVVRFTNDEYIYYNGESIEILNKQERGIKL